MKTATAWAWIKSLFSKKKSYSVKSEWTVIEGDPVFKPGCKFRINVSTGKREVVQP